MSVAPISEDGAPLDALAAFVASAPMRQVLPQIAALDPTQLSAEGRVDGLVFASRLRGFADAMVHRFAAAHVAADADRDNGMDWVREEIATALDIDPDSARGVMVEAEAMVEQFPATLALLEEGEVSTGHARALVQATMQLEPAVAVRVEARVIKRAPEQSVTNFRRSLARAIHALDPRTAEAKHARSREDRRMWNMPQPDGMARLGADLPAEDAAVIQTACEVFADQIRRLNPGDERTKAQLRADALTHFALNYLNGGGSGGACDKRPAIAITINLETLAGGNEQPAELDGYGPITAAVARKIAADPSGTWKRLITDPSGKLLDYKQTTYKPPKALQDHVKARDRRCRFRKCRRRAKLCDLDHRHDWQHGGTTCVLNLECLCERHHQLKHQTRWRLTGNPESTLTWTSPTGHNYTSNPPPQPTAEPPPPDDEDPPPF